MLGCHVLQVWHNAISWEQPGWGLSGFGMSTASTWVGVVKRYWQFLSRLQKTPAICQQMKSWCLSNTIFNVVETEKSLPSVLAGVVQKHCAATLTVRPWSMQCWTTHLMVLNLRVLWKWNWQVEGQGEALQMQHGWDTAPWERLYSWK